MCHWPHCHACHAIARELHRSQRGQRRTPQGTHEQSQPCSSPSRHEWKDRKYISCRQSIAITLACYRTESGRCLQSMCAKERILIIVASRWGAHTSTHPPPVTCVPELPGILGRRPVKPKSKCAPAASRSDQSTSDRQQACYDRLLRFGCAVSGERVVLVRTHARPTNRDLTCTVVSSPARDPKSTRYVANGDHRPPRQTALDQAPVSGANCDVDRYSTSRLLTAGCRSPPARQTGRQVLTEAAPTQS